MGKLLLWHLPSGLRLRLHTLVHPAGGAGGEHRLNVCLRLLQRFRRLNKHPVYARHTVSVNLSRNGTKNRPASPSEEPVK